jgi:hypothetical protein
MRSRWAPSSSAQASGHRWQIPTLGARIFAGTTGMAGAGSPTGVLCSGSPPPRVRAAGGSRASTGTIPQGAGPLLCEDKYGRRVTSGDATIGPLTLAPSVVLCRLMLSGCRAFAACSPPAGGIGGLLALAWP